MSFHFKETGERYRPTYEDGRTVQAFKDDCDINKLLARAAKTGAVSHLAKYEAQYGEFRDFDFLQNALKLRRGQEIFDSLPGEIRREFGQDPAEYFKFVNDPANAGRLHEVLPILARPGVQLRDVSRRQDPVAVGAPVGPAGDPGPSVPPGAPAS